MPDAVAYIQDCTLSCDPFSRQVMLQSGATGILRVKKGLKMNWLSCDQLSWTSYFVLTIISPATPSSTSSFSCIGGSASNILLFFSLEEISSHLWHRWRRVGMQFFRQNKFKQSYFCWPLPGPNCCLWQSQQGGTQLRLHHAPLRNVCWAIRGKLQLFSTCVCISNHEISVPTLQSACMTFLSTPPWQGTSLSSSFSNWICLRQPSNIMSTSGGFLFNLQ